MLKDMLFLTIFLVYNSYAQELKINERYGYFSARVSSFSDDARIVRFKTDFKNIKYVNKLDQLEFWAQHKSDFKCRAIVLGRSSNHLLVKVSEYRKCSTVSAFTEGRPFFFYSKDLVNNIAMGQELVEILAKKRYALQGKVNKNKEKLLIYEQKVEAVNSRYEVLRKKLMLEWRNELSKLENDQIELVRNNEGLKIRLNEVAHKLEKYKIEDTNFVEDRWSLDPNYYYLK
jgi:hypothetical protein